MFDRLNKELIESRRCGAGFKCDRCGKVLPFLDLEHLNHDEELTAIAIPGATLCQQCYYNLEEPVARFKG